VIGLDLIVSIKPGLSVWRAGICIKGVYMLNTKIREGIGFQIVINAFLLAVLVAIVLPLWRVVMTSLTPFDIYNKSGVPFFAWPWEWSLDAYKQVLQQQLFLGAAVNSFIITISGTALSLTLTVPLAYALSTRTLPGAISSPR
jgi:putative aldouronate transport system permease protein